MATSHPNQILLNFLLLLNRVSLGLFFVLAGASKIRSGVGAFYRESFLSLKPVWIPDWFALPYGHALPFVEVLLGTALILGLFGRAAAILTGLVLTSFTIALYEAGAFFPRSGGPFHTNVIFITLALLLAVLGPGSFSLDAFWSRRGPAGR